MKIVVIGGTGLIGSKVVARLTEHGHEAVPASPRLGINTITGEGLAAGLDGASVVVDVSNSPNFEYATALEFFETSTRNLLAAESAAGVGHHVALSVVGTTELSQGGDPETTTAGYFRAKLSQEALIQASSIPYSIVHATQFFEFIKGIADSATDGTHGPSATGALPAHGGRRRGEGCRQGRRRGAGQRHRRDRRTGAVPTSTRLVRRVLAATNDPREVVADPEARYFGIAVGERTLVPGDGAMLGEIRLDDWLSQVAADSKVAVG